MTAAPAPLHGGFAASQMYDVLEQACAHAGLSTTGAELLRGHTNAVVRLHSAPVVVKIARKGTPVESVERTIVFVHWLMEQGFPTVPLAPGIDQPQVIDGHPVTFWTYLPQNQTSVHAVDLAEPLRALHELTDPPERLRSLDNVAAIRRSLTAITALPGEDLEFLEQRTRALETALAQITFALPAAVVQGDPQHRNALREGQRTVLCDWDTVAVGPPEWDLVTVEIHCRRFGYDAEHYQRFARAYGFDVRAWSGYPVLRELRELRMVATNARKANHTPGTLNEVRRRITGYREGNSALRWNIL